MIKSIQKGVFMSALTLKFQPNDLTVTAKYIEFIGNPYSYKSATVSAFNTVAQSDKDNFSFSSDLDLSDYSTLRSSGNPIFGQNNQTCYSGYTGKILHAVHDKDIILKQLDNAYSKVMTKTIERENKEIEGIESQLACLQERLKVLKDKGIKTCDGQHYAREFIENNKKTFLEKLNKAGK